MPMYTWTHNGVIVNPDHEGPPTAELAGDPVITPYYGEIEWEEMAQLRRSVVESSAVPGLSRYRGYDSRSRSRSRSRTPVPASEPVMSVSTTNQPQLHTYRPPPASGPAMPSDSPNQPQLHTYHPPPASMRSHDSPRSPRTRPQGQQHHSREAVSEFQAPEHRVRFREGPNSEIGSQPRAPRIREGEGYRHVRPYGAMVRDIAAGYLEHLNSRTSGGEGERRRDGEASRGRMGSTVTPRDVSPQPTVRQNVPVPTTGRVAPLSTTRRNTAIPTSRRAVPVPTTQHPAQTLPTQHPERPSHPSHHIARSSGPPNGGRPPNTHQETQAPPQQPQQRNNDSDEDLDLARAISLSLNSSATDDDDPRDPLANAPGWPDCQVCGSRPQNISDSGIGFCFACYGEEKAAQGMLRLRSMSREGR